MNKDEKYMLEALKEASYGLKDQEVPIGAVVVCQEKIIARAHNQIERLQDATAHAEMIALTSASHYLGSKYLPQCTLYVTLEPCAMCASALFWCQLGKLVYGSPDIQRGYTRISPALVHKKTSVMSGVRKEECAHLLLSFFEQIRKKKKPFSNGSSFLNDIIGDSD